MQKRCQKAPLLSWQCVVVTPFTDTTHPFWPLEIQKPHAAPVWPSRPLSAVWGVDTVPSKRPERSAPQAGRVQRSHSLLLWDDPHSAGRTPAPNIHINIKRGNSLLWTSVDVSNKSLYALLSSGWSSHFLCILTSGTSSYCWWTPWISHQWDL